MRMTRFFLNAGFLVFLATAAQADQSAPPIIGGQDLPTEVITQLVADGPLVAIPTLDTMQVASAPVSGLKDCGKDVGEECTATMGGISGQ
jgi:hypothetical protein